MKSYTHLGKLITQHNGQGYQITNLDGSLHELSGPFHMTRKSAQAAIRLFAPKISSLTASTQTNETQKEPAIMTQTTTSPENPTSIRVTEAMALKDVRALAKTVPKKAKTMRYVIDGEKVSRYGKSSDLDTLQSLNATVDFSSVPYAQVVKDNSKFETIVLKAASVKGEKAKAAPRESTGFISLIDELLDGQKDTLDSATKKIMVKFPNKDPKSVRRITSNRVNARRRAAMDEDGKLPANFVRLAWLPAQMKSGIMEAIDTHYFTVPAKLPFKDMVADIVTRFPKIGNGDDRDFEATSRIMRNRARILRKSGKQVNYVKSALLDKEARDKKKADKEAARLARQAEREAKSKAGKADAKTEAKIAAGKSTKPAKKK